MNELRRKVDILAGTGLVAGARGLVGVSEIGVTVEGS